MSKKQTKERGAKPVNFDDVHIDGIYYYVDFHVGTIHTKKIKASSIDRQTIGDGRGRYEFNKLFFKKEDAIKEVSKLYGNEEDEATPILTDSQQN